MPDTLRCEGENFMNKVVKGLVRFLIEAAVIIVLMVGVRILTDGMYLLGLPDLEDIRSVGISYPSVTEETKEISNPEDIELALKLTGFLKYDPFEKAGHTEGPSITITYYLKNGTTKTISANDTIVWWNGKSYAIKDKELFVNLAEGIFFLEDIPVEQDAGLASGFAAPYRHKAFPSTS